MSNTRGYFLCTAEQGLFFGKKVDDRFGRGDELVAYADADLGSSADARSTAGYVLILNKTPVVWSSRRIKSAVTSTVEAESVALSECVKSVIEVRTFMREIGFPLQEPTVVYTDSQALLAAIPKNHPSSRIRYFAARIQYLRDQRRHQEVRYQHVGSEHNVADALTKFLPKNALERHRGHCWDNMVALATM